MKYNLKTPEDAIVFFCNMKQLMKTTVVWPHPEELLLSGCKMQDNQNIRLAALSLGFDSPMYATIPMDIVEDKEFQKRLQQGIQGVLKRDYSMKAHIITPLTKDPLKHLKAAIKQQAETWGRVAHFFPRPTWFVQPVIDNLLSVGEIKAFVIGGHLTLKITTTATSNQPSSMQIRDHSVIRPIDAHWSVFKIFTLLEADNPVKLQL
jgi:hypothetical protein